MLGPHSTALSKGMPLTEIWGGKPFILEVVVITSVLLEAQIEFFFLGPIPLSVERHFTNVFVIFAKIFDNIVERNIVVPFLTPITGELSFQFTNSIGIATLTQVR